MNQTTLIPLPRGWTRIVRAAMLQVIALAQYSLAMSEARLARRKRYRQRHRAENDRLRQELALVREELRIKDARMERLAPRKRPHYLATERMAILQLRAARGWSVAQVAQAFLLCPLTISEWMGRLEIEGTEKFLALAEPVNKFPDFVRQAVQRLKAICPRLGKRKIAETLARAGLHLSATTVRRVLREFPKPCVPAANSADKEQPITAHAPNDVWHCDLTTVPTLLGFWAAWLPQALPQRWPFAYWVAVVTDHYSRRVQGIQTFGKQPIGREVRQFLGRAIRAQKAKPRSLVIDKGSQFWCAGFKSWCRQRKIRPRYGAVGRHGSIALVERFIRTLKQEFLRGLVIAGTLGTFQRHLEQFAVWFNGYRPHSALGGQTPNEAYHRRKPANRKPRLEPRSHWPRGSPCAAPQTRVKGKCGERFALHVRCHAGQKQLPIVTLRRVA